MKMLSLECEQCHSMFESNYSKFNNRRWLKIPQLCDTCMKKRISEKNTITSRSRHKTMSIEEKKDLAQKISNGWKTRSPEQKKELSIKKSRERQEWQRSLTEEQRKELSDKMVAGWTSIARDNQSKRRKAYLQSISVEEKQRIVDRLSIASRDYWENLPDEDKLIKLQILWNGGQKRRENMSLKQKLEFATKVSNGLRRYWNDNPSRKDELAVTLKTFYDNNPEIKLRLSNIRKLWWDNLTEDELEQISKRERDRWDNLNEVEKTKISNRSKRWWGDLTHDQFVQWRTKYNKGRSTSKPKKIDLEFMKDLDMICFISKNFSYAREVTNKKIHPDFDRLFNTNPATGSDKISPYHAWDYCLMCLDKIIFVDIDGSIHDILPGEFVAEGIDIGINIKFNDSQRPYQTDGHEAYIIEAYSDHIRRWTLVRNVGSGKAIRYEEFINYIRTWSK